MDTIEHGLEAGGTVPLASQVLRKQAGPGHFLELGYEACQRVRRMGDGIGPAKAGA